MAGIRKRSFDVGLALTALGRLLAGPEGGANVAPAWRAGAIEATLEAMEQHAHDHRVVLPACKVLGACTVLRGISHVAMTENAAVCADVVKHGGVALLVAAYGAWADDEEVEGVVLETLINLGALEDPVTMEKSRRMRSAAKSVRVLARKEAHVVVSTHPRHRAKGALEETAVDRAGDETAVGGAGGETATTTAACAPQQALLALPPQASAAPKWGQLARDLLRAHARRRVRSAAKSVQAPPWTQNLQI